MELVPGAFAAQGGNDVSIGHHLRQVRQHHFVEGRADTVLLGIFQFAGKQGNGVGVQSQVCAEVIVDLLDAAGPFGVIRVGFALVQQHSLDDAVFLRFARGLHQALVRAHPILLGHVHEPASRRVGGFHCQIFLAGVLVPEFKLGSGN